MIWDSILLMTIIDLTIIGLSLYSFLIFRKYNSLLKKLKLEKAVIGILSGLLTISLFYIADLLIMYVLPWFTSHQYAMQVMHQLHLNVSWLIMLLGVSLTVTALSRLISKLVPQTYRTLTNLKAVEAEIRELNLNLERKVKTRTLELEETNRKLVQEIKGREIVQKSLSESEDRYRRLVERVPALIYSYSSLKGGIYYSPQVKAYLGYSSDYLSQNPYLWHNSIHPDDLPQVTQVIQDFVDGKDFKIEYRIRDAQGNWHWFCDFSVGSRTEGDEIVIEGVAFDITTRKHLEAHLEHKALHDSLTQLPNRSFLMKQIDQCLQKTKNNRSYTFAVLFIDVDRFKVINDSMGHQYGDQLLLELAKRFEQVIQPLGIVARLGGDEFVILLNSIQTHKTILETTEALIRQVQTPIVINNLELVTTVSIGVALSSPRYKNGVEILRDADNAMYKAKEKGRNGYCLFDQSMYEQAVRTLHLQTSLSKGLLSQEFQLHYQPILCLKHQKLVGFETLVRWNHPQHGMILPFEFINLAEETGLITELGRWILFESCRQLKAWQAKYDVAHAIKVSVNLSGRQLQQPNFINMLDTISHETGLHPKYLKLEITESILIENSEIIGGLFKQLNQRQIEVCIDDFGTGYSSLSYIHSFPFDTLKIDKSFVQSNLDNDKQMRMLDTIVNVAHHLGMNVVAEGIETPEQNRQLQKIGCEMGQGYLFSRPLPPEAIEASWLAVSCFQQSCKA